MLLKTHDVTKNKMCIILDIINFIDYIHLYDVPNTYTEPPGAFINPLTYLWPPRLRLAGPRCDVKNQPKES